MINSQHLFLVFILSMTTSLTFGQIDLDNPHLNKRLYAGDDLFVNNSACIGNDCPGSGYPFGFSTIAMSENNTRILFDDTSTPGSFPSRDWMLEANGSNSGDLEYFSIVDFTNNTVPFRVLGTAPNGSLWIDADGDVGIGVGAAAPNLPVEFTVRDGNSPTIRLEQDGSNGFTSQTWDIYGNEANFTVRDLTNGATEPFRISPGAPSNMISINGVTDRVGIGIRNPDSYFQVRKPAESGVAETIAEFDINQDQSGTFKIQNSTNENDRYAPEILATHGYDKSALTLRAVVSDTIGNEPVIRMAVQTSADTNGIEYPVANRPVLRVENFGANLFEIQPDGSFSFDNTTLVVNGTSNRVGIGTGNPAHRLHVQGNIGLSGRVFGVSDVRLKKDIMSIGNALDIVSRLDGKSYMFRTDDYTSMDLPVGRQFGLLAQDVERVLPEVIEQTHSTIVDEHGDQIGFKGINYSAFIPVLINALNEQQSVIESQQAEIDLLRSQFESLMNRVNDLEGKSN